jgi:hypothetical protein
MLVHIQGWGNGISLTMLNQRCFNLSGGETMPRDINDIVDAASNPVVTFVVSASTIARELNKR